MVVIVPPIKLINNKSSLSEKALSDFAVKDTASIDRINLSDTKGHAMTFVKSNHVWTLEAGECVQQHMIATFLETFKYVSVKSPVPEGAVDNMNTQIMLHHKKIEIYQNGTFQELQTYHTHILSGNALMNYGEEPFSSKHKTIEDNYLKYEVEQLEKLLRVAKNKHTYKVLTEYKKPLSFVDELLAYYKDRIFKLKKRTRKADKFDLL